MFLFPGTVFYGLILLLLVHFLRSLLLFLPSNCKGGTNLSWRRRVCSCAHLYLPLHMQHKLLLIGVWTGRKVYFGIKPCVGHNLLILWETTIVNSDQPCFWLASAESWQCHQQCGRCNTPNAGRSKRGEGSASTGGAVWLQLADESPFAVFDQGIWGMATGLFYVYHWEEEEEERKNKRSWPF